MYVAKFLLQQSPLITWICTKPEHDPEPVLEPDLEQEKKSTERQKSVQNGNMKQINFVETQMAYISSLQMIQIKDPCQTNATYQKLLEIYERFLEGGFQAPACVMKSNNFKYILYY